MALLSLQTISTSHRTVGTSRLTISGRDSLLLSLTTPEGVVMGEASPLEGYGVDSFETARADLESVTVDELLRASREVSSAYRAFELPLSGLLSGPSSPIEQAERMSRRLKSPAAKFCVEMVILGAAAGSCGVPLFRLLAASPVASVLEPSSVVDPLAIDWQEDVWRKIEAGLRVFKLKCGRDMESELRVARFLLEHPSGLSLRFDANGALSPNESAEFLGQLPRGAVEWFEDPSFELSAWPTLRQKTSVRLALDEPLCAAEDESLLDRATPDVLVLKPMALGGFSAALKWARVAQTRGLLVTVSHLFDGPLALDACIHLAFSIQSKGVAAGLGNHEGLSGFDGHIAYRPRWLAPSGLLLPRC